MSPYKTVINGIKRLFQRPANLSSPQSGSALDVSEHPSHRARIIPRDEHPISRSHISRNAVKVLYRLHDAGYQAYLVGGGVRDLLLDKHPKDFDVATNAKPEEVRSLFRNCRLIGRRFRLAHVHFGREIIEVATFRAPHGEQSHDGVIENGRILRDNVYGTLEDDAWRRDFTINSLYYNIADFSVVDYINGMDDIQQRLLRLIGDPLQRYREDPVRMLRAVRFRAKLDFNIEAQTEAPLFNMGHLLGDIPASRLFEECLKLFLTGHAQQSLDGLRHYGLFNYLFPQLEAHFSDPAMQALVAASLRNTDARVAANKPVIPAFLFAALLWTPTERRMRELMEQEEKNPQDALFEAAHQVLHQQKERVAIPRRIMLDMRDIWWLHLRLLNNRGKRALRLLTHPRFRAAFDFLSLRAEAEAELRPVLEWWGDIAQADEERRQQLITQQPSAAAPDVGETRPRKPRRRRGGRSRRRSGPNSKAPTSSDAGE